MTDRVKVEAHDRTAVMQAHDKMLGEVISEIEHMLSRQHDQLRVSRVLSSLASRYRDVRITTFLPMLIYKEASKVLSASQSGEMSIMADRQADMAAATKMHFLRFEFKYVLGNDLCARIEKAIEDHMTLDPYVAGKDGRSYSVRSLYYDDAGLSSYYQKVEGALLRSKFRLRTYTDDPGEECATYLELKGRYNSLVFKRRAYFDIAAALRNCRNVTEQIANKVNGSPIGEEFLAELAHKHINPIMLIEYVRRPYISREDPDFRLTLDENLHGTATDQLFPDNLHGRRPILHGHTVMEVKFKNSIPLWFHRIIKSYSLKRVSISKVCKGIEACHLAPTLD